MTFNQLLQSSLSELPRLKRGEIYMPLNLPVIPGLNNIDDDLKLADCADALALIMTALNFFGQTTFSNNQITALSFCDPRFLTRNDFPFAVRQGLVWLRKAELIEVHDKAQGIYGFTEQFIQETLPTLQLGVVSMNSSHSIESIRINGKGVYDTLFGGDEA